MDRIPIASENNLPNLPAKTFDIPLDVIQVELLKWAHVK